jgi:hypothetical protein
MARQHLALALSEMQSPATLADASASQPARDSVPVTPGALARVDPVAEGAGVASLVAPTATRQGSSWATQTAPTPGASPMAPVRMRPDLAMVAPTAQRPDLVLTAPVVERPGLSVVAPVSVPLQATLVALGLDAAPSPAPGLSTRAILGLEPEAPPPPPPVDRAPTDGVEKISAADQILAARIVLGLEPAPAPRPARLVVNTRAGRNAMDSRLPGAGG